MAKFEAGKPRHPKAGRKKGTPNVFNKTIQERIIESGCDPLQVLFECLAPECEYRFAAAKELMQYVYPKLSSLDVGHFNANEADQRIVDEISEAVERAKLLEEAK